ncbi:TonB-dependent receptor [Paludibaculum fermentans]|uniref:TonB-dependent receptor n=1 Tax=Paludibaculum fermentans TaxID=1473598 RepID=A0A7S7NT10_PALFE|nr:TonB-dependent receptor [Paludibaculum fermentans]QOY89179.1 TonB-dependent receptor [Paludibaculum fermentans]
MRNIRVTSGVGTLLSIAISCFSFLGVNAPPAIAQVLYGSLVGTITDQSSAVVVKAAVTVTNTSTGLTVQANTDQSGYYAIQNLMEGSYDVSITAPGFKTVTQKGVDVRINNVTRTDVRLELGGVAETITVAASAAVLQTSKADVSTNIESRAITNLPLSGYRNYQTLMNLVPGATPVQFQNAVIDTPQRDLSTNINGQERGANNTRVDGAANILVTMPHHMVYVPPVESIEEVNISTNNFDADQGMTGGAAVTVATKSGTNSFHGSAFGFNANNVTRAMLWDENRTGTTKKPNGNRNIVGGSVGGPIKKGKLFFFTDWEGTFERVGRSSLFSLPTDDFRAGDFSRKLGSQILDAQGRQISVPTTEGGLTALREGMVFDPYSGNMDGTGRSVFSSNGRLNVIPSSRFNAPMQKLLALVPHANQAGDLSNYFNQGTQRLNRNNLDAKINWNRSAKNQIWGKYSVMDALVRGDFGLGAAGGGCLCDGGVGEGHTLVQLAAIGQTYTVSPTFLIDGTLGWTRFGQNVQSPDLGTNFGLDVLGIPGTNGPDPKESGMPAFYISDYSGLGNTEGWNPLFRNDQSITFNTNASWMKGRHDIRFGFEFLHHLMNHWQPELGEGPRGAFYFASGLTALNPAALEQTVGFRNGTPSFEETWNGMGAFLLGASNETGKSSQFIKMNSMENVYALYVRDRWRVSSKLTLNLGLRWELYPTRTRSAGMGVESYDPSTNEVLVGGYGGIPRDAGVGYSKKLFAPRIGLAYQLGNNTVIRSGYGITYHSHPWGAQALRGWYPLTLVSVFDGVNGYQPVTTDPNYVKAGVPNQPLGPNVGIIPICCPDISKGRIPLPASDEMGYPVANEQMKRGYIQSWNFIVEHKLPGEILASLGYVATASVNGFAFLDINASQIPGSGNDGRLLYQRFGRTATTREWNGRTHSIYHSMQASVNRRLTSGLLIKGAYTYSHAIDQASYGDWTAFNWNAASVFDRNRANSNFNIPHMFQVGYVYELPFGKTKKWATSGLTAAVLGDWQFNGLFAAYQGRQFTVTASGSSLNMPGNLQTADQVKPDVAKLGLVGDDGTWFDTTAFARPTGARFGTVGRNTMRGPGVINADLSLYRTFKITEAINLQFRGESFNLSNTPHFANPTNSANSSNFGRILATQSGDAMGRSREFRFGLRLGF